MTTLRSGSATDVGKVRSSNQDQLLSADPLFAVADGMGGHAAGEVASLTAVEALRQAFDRDRSPSGLVAATREANRSVWERAQANPEQRGMGTTLVALALVQADGEDRLAIVNVGDSRVYLLRQGELEQVTTDHSLVQELIDVGQLSQADAGFHPQRHVLTRALGIDPDVDVDEIEILPVKGDRYLLCSDGLPREVSDEQMASVLRRLADPKDAARELVAQARARGGNDNITVVVVDVVDDDDRAVAASAALAADPGVSIPAGAADEPGEHPPSEGETAGRRRNRLSPRDRSAPRARAMTVRVVGFGFLLAAVIAAVLAAIGLYARGSYYVGIADDRLTIYRGRPGGLLWFQPTVAEKTDVATTAVLPSRLTDLQNGKQEATLADARKYVDNLRTEAAAHEVGTGPPTSAPPTVPTTAPGAPVAPTPGSAPATAPPGPAPAAPAAVPVTGAAAAAVSP
jgi:protein phosphatase